MILLIAASSLLAFFAIQEVSRAEITIVEVEINDPGKMSPVDRMFRKRQKNRYWQKMSALSHHHHVEHNKNQHLTTKNIAQANAAWSNKKPNA